MISYPLSFTLSDEEFEILMKQNPATKEDGGYQGLLVKLQESTSKSTKAITIDEATHGRIMNYAFNYGNGGWEDRLKGIFEEHLGTDLSGNSL